MIRVGIRQLKDGELSRAIRRAQRGESVLVTDRGVPVARIVPVERTGPPREIEDLVARGLIEYRALVWSALDEPVEMLPGVRTIDEYVREQRA